MSFFMRPSRSTYVLQNGAKRFMKSHLDFCYSNNFTRYFPRHISFLFWNHMLSCEIVKKLQCDFTKEFGTIVQLFEFNPLSKCANKAVYQICLFWNWTEWEQCTNSKSPVEWYAIFYSNTCSTCFFWIEKKGY